MSRSLRSASHFTLHLLHRLGVERRALQIAASAAALMLLGLGVLFERPVTGRADNLLVLEGDKTGYLAGEAVNIRASGFAPGEIVTFQVVHAGGGAEPGMGHDPWSAVADEAGVATGTWSIDRLDAAGLDFEASATGEASGAAPAAAFKRIAVVSTDKLDYRPEEMVQIAGSGFLPNEVVTLQVLHLSALAGGNGHEPFTATSDANGDVAVQWFVDPDDSLGAILHLSAVGANSGLTAVTIFYDAFVTIVDDGGPDDVGGQSQRDLNLLSVDRVNLPTALGVVWNWDNTGFSGGNTGDACSLYDTNNNGFTNFALCVVVDGNPAAFVSTRLYSCNDSRSDRCSGDVLLKDTVPGTPQPLPASTCSAGVVSNSDPFALAPTHTTSKCAIANSCVQNDTVAGCTVQLSDLGGAGNAFLLNVCAYPSQQPNSDPADCVVAPNSGFLTIKKVDTEPGDTTAFTFNTNRPISPTSFTINGTGQVSLISFTAGGAYSITEVVPAGWQLDSATCVRSDGAGTGTRSGNTVSNIEIQAGLETVCTFTDSKQKAHLTVIKHVINDNGGTAVAGDFTMSVTGTAPSPSSFAGEETPGTIVELNAGTYSVSETGPSGYSSSFSSDCSGTIGAGESRTCTVTNDDQAGTLIVIKHVINDNGGTATAGDFTLDSGGTNDSPDNFAGAEAPGTTVTLDAGAYSVTETGPSGYTQTNSADCSGTIANGQTKTCTVTNDDQPGTLIVIKHVINDNGGSATAGDFTLDSGGTNDSPDNFAGAEAPGTTVTLDAGAYSVTETGPSGYTQTNSADCSGTIANGQTKTCTVTNDDQPGTLIVIKHVINDNGGTATAGDFTLDSGGTNDSPDNFAGAEAPGTTVTLDAGAYSVTETGPSGYTQTNSADCSGTIANGQTKTCTVTNDDQPGTLIVIKHVINDNGGSATAGDFTLDSGGTNDSPDNFAGAEAPGTTVTLDAGAYSVTETGPSGYTQTNSADCSGTIANGQTKTCTVTNDDQPGTLIVIKHVINDNGGSATAGDFTLDSGGANDSPDNFAGAEAPGTTVTLDAGAYSVSETGPSGYTQTNSADCSGTIANGQTKTCTVTNDDQPGTLIVIKHVINDNGGSATAGDFTLDSGGANDSPDNFAGAEAPGTTVTLDAGAYSVSETGPSGYTQTNSADCSGTIANGQTKTCTVTNDDQPGTLIVIKHVINDNGGSATAGDFTLDSGGANDSPDDFAGAEAPGTTVTLDAGAYSVTETGPSGYTQTNSADCSGTIANGQTKTCTVTNDDQPGTLIVIKHVINDNGGSATAGDFTLDSGGANDSPDNFAGAEAPGTTVTLDAGAYSVSETGPSGYTQTSSADCSGTIANGQTKTCTVTNDDQPGTLIVIKHVINDNGGAAVASDFTLDSGGTNDSPDNFAGAEAPGTAVTLDAGAYSVTESGPSGYTQTNSADCSGTIANGQTKTCTVTNDDQPGTLIVIKHVINDNGGAAVASDFTLDSGGTNDSPDNFAGAEAPGTAVTLDAGAYSVTESGPSGYTQTNSADCSGTIANGQTKTCTVTNDDIPATLIVEKICVPATDTGQFNLRIDGVTAGNGANAPCGGSTGPVLVNAGTHTVSETAGTGTNLSDYLAPAIGGACSSNGTIQLALAQTATCTITNTKKGQARVVKTISQGPIAEPGSLGVNTFTFQVRQGASSTDAGTLVAGPHDVVVDLDLSPPSGEFTFAEMLDPTVTYQLCETVQPGWMTTLGPPFFVLFNPSGDNSVVCTNFTVQPGETKAFEVDNRRPPGGMTRTIGFWKNWSSCTGGGQAPVLDRSLARNEPAGTLIGDLVLHGSAAVPDIAPDCVTAVRILNKSRVDTGKKMASDAAFNMAAQLLAAKLNVAAGAGVCPAAITAINAGQALLDLLNFNGITHATMTADQVTEANTLAITLDRYNNDNTLLCAAP